MADTTTTPGPDTQTTPGTPTETVDVKGNSPLSAPTETVETKPGEEKPGETKPGEKTDDKKPEDKKDEKPAALDIKALKLPEGVTLDEKVGGEFASILTDDKLSPQDRMQKLVDLHTAEVQKIAGAPLATWNTTVEQWTKELAADKEIGSGDSSNPLKAIKPDVMAKLGKVMDMLGGQPLRAAMELTGAGHNPAVIKAFVKIADKYTEGGHVQGNPPGRDGKPSGIGAHALYRDNPTEG